MIWCVKIPYYFSDPNVDEESMSKGGMPPPTKVSVGDRLTHLVPGSIVHGPIQRVWGQPVSIPLKNSQVAIGFPRNPDTDPLEATGPLGEVFTALCEIC